MAEQWEYRQGPGYTRAAGLGPQQPRPVHSQPPATPPQFRRDDPPTAPPSPSFTPGYQSQRPRAQYAPQQPAWQPQPPPVQQPWQPPVQQPWQPPKPPRKNRAGLIGCTGLSGVVFVILLAVAFSNSPSSTTPPAAQTGRARRRGRPCPLRGT